MNYFGKIWMNVILIIASLSAGIIGSYAYLTATESNKNNIFTAGTLDLSVTGDNNQVNEPILIEDIGATPEIQGSKTWKIKNTGSLRGRLLINTDNIENLKTVRTIIETYAFRHHTKPKYQERAKYAPGTLIRTNGVIEYLIPHSGEINNFESLSPVNQLRFNVIRMALGNNYVCDDSGKGIYYSLTDVKMANSQTPYKFYIGFAYPSEIEEKISKLTKSM